jgi:hypothetical protein
MCHSDLMRAVLQFASCQTITLYAVQCKVFRNLITPYISIPVLTSVSIMKLTCKN